ncbi:YdcF family protein [Prosthecochloris sp. CIB 2401]|uniref:YdcF family protein n=1 Tax=Prosthecochloris sp. CIB 2401 TaxID=1868325 RepID=UPI00080A9F28|nr:YdcF family protein [Prosthecochloris sp. CIB 2401]ANT64445.1 hypothetical protein Ptc2401_00649 [Prosthecochloris sp. CIB 2401]
MLIFHKVLPVFFLPLGFGLLVIVAGALFKRWFAVWVGVTLLYLLAMPISGDALMRIVEDGNQVVPIRQVEKADAVVVLGGMVRYVPGAAMGEWGEAADRFFAGVSLYQAGKAPVLVFPAGRMPWMPHVRPEGDLLRERALLEGVPADAMFITPEVQNTADEAREVRTLLQYTASPRVILVTSAFHMPRAAMMFRFAGMEVEPYPVDFRTDYYKEWTPYDVLPSVRGLENSELALRELIGLAYYRLAHML